MLLLKRKTYVSYMPMCSKIPKRKLLKLIHEFMRLTNSKIELEFVNLKNLWFIRGLNFNVKKLKRF